MKRYRVNFFWDCRGCSTVLWVRYCTLPEGFGPLNVVDDGLWVREKTSPTPYADAVAAHAGLYIPTDSEMVFDRLAGTAWIPPGRISSVTEDQRFIEGMEP